MPMQQVEFDFPEPDKPSAVTVEVEQDVADEGLEIEGAVGRETVAKKKKNLKVDDVEIEVVNDVPLGDRNRKQSKLKNEFNTSAKATTTSGGQKSKPCASARSWSGTPEFSLTRTRS